MEPLGGCARGSAQTEKENAMTLSDLYMNLALMVGVSLLVAAAMVVVPNIDNIQDWKRRKAITGTRLDGQR
jgi:hypothetical protein